MSEAPTTPAAGRPGRSDGGVSIRRYRPADEAAVRAICFETGFQGRPASLWLDISPDLFADVWLLYYLREAAHLMNVAEHEGRVVGYLAGCVDIPAREHFYRTRFPWLLLSRWRRGRYRVGRRTFAVLGRHLRDGWVYGRPRVVSDKPCADFHCNVLDAFRGRQYRCGFRLTQPFLADMKRLGLTRLWASALVRRDEVEGRYRFVSNHYEARKTTVFAGVEDGEYVHLEGYADFEDPDLTPWWRRYWAEAKPLDTPDAREVGS